MGNQTRLQSLKESIILTFIGSIFGFLMSFVVFPLCGVTVNIIQVSGVTFVFMVIGVTRNYFVRRVFNMSRKKQKKHQSFLESFTQTAIATLFSFVLSIYIYPLFGIDASLVEISGITGLFTLFSITKNYIIRRYFVKKV